MLYEVITIEGHSHVLLHPYNETEWNDQVLKESPTERAVRGVVHAKNSIRIVPVLSPFLIFPVKLVKLYFLSLNRLYYPQAAGPARAAVGGPSGGSGRHGNRSGPAED